jgi:hypothetical protein
MEVFFLPLMILNMLGGVVAGIWLIVLGNWLALAIGMAIAFLGNWVINIALMPSMLLFGGPATALQNSGKRVGALFFGCLNLLYIAALITFWCVGTLALLSALAKNYSVVAFTLFSYGCATAPWAYLAQKDQQSGGNEYSNTSVLFAEVAFIGIGLFNILGQPSFGALLGVFAGFMALAVVLEIIMAVHQSNRERRSVINS